MLLAAVAVAGLLAVHVRVVALVVAGVLLGVSLLGAVSTWGSPYGRAVWLLVLLLLGLALLARMTSGGPLTGPWYGSAASASARTTTAVRSPGCRAGVGEVFRSGQVRVFELPPHDDA